MRSEFTPAQSCTNRRSGVFSCAEDSMLCRHRPESDSGSRADPKTALAKFILSRWGKDGLKVEPALRVAATVSGPTVWRTSRDSAACRISVLANFSSLMQLSTHSYALTQGIRKVDGA